MQNDYGLQIFVDNIYQLQIYQYLTYEMATLQQLPDEVRKLLPLTPAVLFVLLALSEGDKHGYAIMQDANELSDGQFRMGPGTLYTTIQRLLDLSLIEETEGSSGHSSNEGRRRYYRLARSGRQLLSMELGRMENLVRRAREKKLVPRTAD